MNGTQNNISSGAGIVLAARRCIRVHEISQMRESARRIPKTWPGRVWSCKNVNFDVWFFSRLGVLIIEYFLVSQRSEIIARSVNVATVLTVLVNN